MSPEFTVIIPSYNHENFIGCAIKSALNQKEVDHEVIVIDDGSLDNSLKIIREFKDHPKIRIVEQENQGISKVFNKGVELARGKYIGYVCSDDCWDDDHLLKAKNCFQSQKGKIAFVWGKARAIDESGQPVSKKEFNMFHPPIEGEDLFRQLCRKNFIPFISVVSQTEKVKEVGGFDNEIGILQDFDLWLRLLTKNNACYHGHETVSFRWHGANESGPHLRGAIIRRQDQIKICDKLLLMDLEKVNKTDTKEILFKIRADNHARLARRLSDPKQKSENYQIAWKYRPWKLDHFAKYLWYLFKSH